MTIAHKRTVPAYPAVYLLSGLIHSALFHHGLHNLYGTNIIDFAVSNGFAIEKSDKATVHVKNYRGLYLFRHGRGYYSFTEEKGGNIVEFAMHYLGLEKRDSMRKP